MEGKEAVGISCSKGHGCKGNNSAHVAVYWSGLPKKRGCYISISDGINTCSG